MVTMVVAFQMNYIRIHLLTEFHHRGGYSVPIAGHCHDQSGEHGHDHAPHQPHSTDDHSLQLAGKRSCLLQSLELLL
ncbi:MAG TPA: hypothetical protein PKA41_17615, partial [Verrucomicrobiota bacterium]|nr:hypothetical protein [Verrucomicrobiota bacterium]